MREAVVEQEVSRYFTDRFPQFSVSQQCEVQFGTRHGIADVVLHEPIQNEQGRFVAIAECKRWPLPVLRGKAKAQLKSYMSATNTQYGVLAVGTDPRNWEFCENKFNNWFVSIDQSTFETGVRNWQPVSTDASAVDLQQERKVTRRWKHSTLAFALAFLISLGSVFLVWQKSPPEPSRPPFVSEMAMIPAGDFQRGSNDTEADDDEQPVRMIYLDTFYIDRYEVTNAQYKQFVDANPLWQKDRIPSQYHDGDYLKHWEGNNYPESKENHPVVYISWYAAMAYAEWAGKRLPTEAEWEKAARGGLVEKAYPWGNSIDPSKANYSAEIEDTTSVGNYPANAYGLYDMSGNAWEWCLDLYETDFYDRSPLRNPVAGESLTEITETFRAVHSPRVLRGGYWNNPPVFVRVADRYKRYPGSTHRGSGFRCVVGSL